MANPTIEEVIATYRMTGSLAIADAERALFQSYWLKDLLPLMVDAYPSIPQSAGRAALLARLPRMQPLMQYPMRTITSTLTGSTPAPSAGA